MTWPGCGHVAVGEGIVVTELPAIESALFAQFIDQAFQAKDGLVDAKAAHGAAGQVVGVNGRGFHISHREMYRRRWRVRRNVPALSCPPRHKPLCHPQICTSTKVSFPSLSQPMV